MDKEYLENDLDLEKIRTKSVFISYGHDEFIPYARRLVEDLKEYVNRVWFDEKQIRDSHLWDQEIEDGISNSMIVIALMTQHAYRRPNGVCLNEVVYASNASKEIIPVMVQDVSIPLLLCRIQFVDVREIYDPVADRFDEELYQDTFRRLLICIEDPTKYGDNSYAAFKKYLQPIDNRQIISIKTKDYVGRQWLLDTVKTWVEKEDESSVFMLLGGPGTGKSAFVAKLAMEMEAVKGVHFCNFQDKGSLRVKTLINTLAYYLSVEIPEYQECLNVDLSELASMEDFECFRVLILEPLGKIRIKDQKIVLAVDGIDEMERAQMSSFLDMLENFHKAFPLWFKLVITARKNLSTENHLVSLRPHIIEAGSEENLQDLRAYLSKKLEGNVTLTEEEILELIERSEGCFQYLVQIIPEIIKNGGLAGVNLPRGIAGAYENRFDRLFPERDGYKEVKPLLEVLCAAKEPLTKKQMKEILGKKYDLNAAEELLGDYLINLDGKLAFFHKSIADWLLSGSTKYSIEAEEGQVKIADWIVDNADGWDEERYLMKYGFLHLFEADYCDEFCDILNEQEEICMDSFGEFLSEAFAEDHSCSKLFRKIMKQVEHLDRYLCTILHNSYEKRGYTEFIALVADAFEKQVDWISDYAELLKCLGNGDLTEGGEIGNRILEGQEDKDIRAILLNDIGECYRVLGDFQLALETYYKAFSEYPKSLYAEKCFWSWYNYHDMKAVQGFIEEADSAMEEMLRKVDDDSIMAFKLWRVRGNIKLYLGEREKSADCYRKCLEIATKLYSKRLMGEANYVIAEALAGVDQETAWNHLNEAIRLEQQLDYKPGYARTYMARTELLAAEENWEETVRIGLEGIERLNAVDYTYGAARVARSVAKAYDALGEYEKAYEHAVHAHSFLKAKNAYPGERYQAWEELKRIAEKVGKAEEAQRADRQEDMANVEQFLP